MNGQTVVTGCVNVAVAQVMRYHRHPAASQGVVSYLWDGPPEQTLKTILFRSYNWDNMPGEVDSTTPDYQADEVALLIRDIGIANQTDFDVAGSSTSLNSRMLLENFGYSTSLSDMDNADFGSFLATLRGEIDAERPVLLSLPGHMTVADGYRTDGTGESVHINLGWGGSDDDFYFLDGPIHAGSYIFPVDAHMLRIYFNIKPCSAAAGDCAVNRETGDGINGPAIEGNFNQERDKDLYEAYLKGPTTIRGTRGYTQNLGFSMSIYSLLDGSEVFPAPDPNGPPNTDISAGSLPAGKYGIRVSLCNVEESILLRPGSGLRPLYRDADLGHPDGRGDGGGRSGTGEAARDRQRSSRSGPEDELGNAEDPDRRPGRERRCRHPERSEQQSCRAGGAPERQHPRTDADRDGESVEPDRRDRCRERPDHGESLHGDDGQTARRASARSFTVGGTFVEQQRRFEDPPCRSSTAPARSRE